MRKITSAFIIFAAASATAGAAHASVGPINANAPVFAAGSMTCTQWVTAQATPDSSDARAQRYWVAGVMSAYNIYAAPAGFNVGAGVKPDDLRDWMTGRCTAYPKDTIGQAAQAFIAYLVDRQQKSPSGK